MISSKHVFEEIKSPQEVEAMEEPNMLGLIYREIYMALRLLVDIRTNQTQISKKLGVEFKSNVLTTKAEVE